MVVNMNKIITNSTPIIGLSIIGKLPLLIEIFDDVFLPNAVYQEIVHSNYPRRYGKDELDIMVSKGVF